MSARDRAIRSLCVVGAGAVGLSAALAFARSLPGLRVTILDTPSDPAALADRTIACLPTIHRFHASIGLDELGLVREGIALHHLGTRFENWSASGAAWFHVFGDYGLPAAAVPFHQLWAQLRRADGAEPYDRYAAAASLAEAGKFVHPTDDTGSPLSSYLYGLRLDPEKYRARLLEDAQKRRFEIVTGELAGIERRQDGGIATLRLGDGGGIEADLYLDCAGPSAPLRSAIDQDFDDWSDCLPCDRVAFAPPRAALSSLPYDRQKASTDGWIWACTLPGSEAFGAAWSSGSSDDAQALQSLREMAGTTDSPTVTIRPGRRLEPWKYNVLAIGDSAVTVDPLHSTHLHLAHSFIQRALELIPGRDCHRLELAEFNRRTADETARVRDFLALHYLRSGRTEGEFWKAAARGRMPDSLAHTLDQFETRGRLPFFEEETFNQESWLAVLIGLGVIPRNADPASDRVDLKRAESSMAQLAAALAELPARLPEYGDYLDRMRGPQPA